MGSSLSTTKSYPFSEIANRTKSWQFVAFAPSVEGHSGAILGCSVHPSDGTFATTSGDGTVKVWDFETKVVHRTLHGHVNEVFGCNFAPNGLFLVSTSDDGTIRKWEVSSGHCIGLIPALDHLAIQAERARNVAIGQPDRSLPLYGEFVGHRKPAFCVAVSPKSDLIASCGIDAVVKVWDAQTLELVADLEKHKGWIRCVTFSPDGTFLASCGDDKAVILWSAEDFGYARTFSAERSHRSWVHCCAFSPNSELLVSSGGDAFMEDHTILIWRVMSGDLLLRIDTHTAPVLWCGFNASGDILATADFQGTARLWSMRDVPPERGHSLRSKMVMPAMWSGAAQASSKAGKAHRTPSLLRGAGEGVHDGARDKVEKMSLDGDSDAASELSDEAWERSAKGRHATFFRRILTTREGGVFHESAVDKRYTGFGSLLRVLRKAHTDAVHSCGFSADGLYFMTASLDRTVKVWGLSDVWTAPEPDLLWQSLVGRPPLPAWYYDEDGRLLSEFHKQGSVRRLAAALDFARSTRVKSPTPQPKASVAVPESAFSSPAGGDGAGSDGRAADANRTGSNDDDGKDLWTKALETLAELNGGVDIDVHDLKHPPVQAMHPAAEGGEPRSSPFSSIFGTCASPLSCLGSNTDNTRVPQGIEGESANAEWVRERTRRHVPIRSADNPYRRVPTGGGCSGIGGGEGWCRLSAEEMLAFKKEATKKAAAQAASHAIAGIIEGLQPKNNGSHEWSLGADFSTMEARVLRAAACVESALTKDLEELHPTQRKILLATRQTVPQKVSHMANPPKSPQANSATSGPSLHHDQQHQRHLKKTS
eukprot:Rmarinus@m.15116